jgi:hypothetical protein
MAAPSSADELRGTVRDPSGAPVVGADFDVFDPVTGVKLLASDHTDAAGRYSLQLDLGIYDVLCEPDTASGHAAKMVRGVAVSGTVTMDLTLCAVRGGARSRVRRAQPGPRHQWREPPWTSISTAARTACAPRCAGRCHGAAGGVLCVRRRGSYTITATPNPATGLAPARVFGWAVPSSEYLQLPLFAPAT